MFVYVQDTQDILKENYLEQIEYDGNDIVGYELGKYLSLLHNNNPNILESLDIPQDCLIYKDKSMEVFTQEYWLTKKTKNSILGYANSQIRKSKGLYKNMNNPQPKERKSILEFCYIIEGAKSYPLLDWLGEYSDEHKTAGLVAIPNGKGMYAIYFDYDDEENFRGIIQDEDSSQLRLSSIPKEFAENHKAHILYYNLDGFQIHCSQHASYWKWMKEKNEVRYNMNQEAGQNIDLKNMMHLFRLLDMCENIALGNGICVRSKNIDYLLDIRKGKYNYKDLLLQSERRFKAIDLAFEALDLKEDLDINTTKEILLSFRLAYLKI